MAAQKVVLITAGTAGLGAQIARAFAADHRVVGASAQQQRRIITIDMNPGNQLCQQRFPRLFSHRRIEQDPLH